MVLPDSVEFVYTWFGVLKAGGVFAMVNHGSLQDYSYYLSYTRARVLVTTREVADRIGPAIEESPWLKSVFSCGWGGSSSGHTTSHRKSPPLPTWRPTGMIVRAGCLPPVLRGIPKLQFIAIMTLPGYRALRQTGVGILRRIEHSPWPSISAMQREPI